MTSTTPATVSPSIVIEDHDAIHHAIEVVSRHKHLGIIFTGEVKLETLLSKDPSEHVSLGHFFLPFGPSFTCTHVHMYACLRKAYRLTSHIKNA